MKTLRLKLLSFFIVTVLILAPLASAPVSIARASGTNLITNGDFSGGFSSWFGYGVTTDTSGGDLQATNDGSTTNPWDAGVGQSNVAMLNGTEYRIKFTASAVPDVAIHVVVQNPDTYANYIDQVVNLTSTPTTFTYTFTATEDKATAKFIYQLGGSTAFVGHFDNVSVMPIKEMLTNGDFSGGFSSWFGYGVTTDTSGGDLQITSDGSTTNPWDAGVGQSNVAMLNGDEYQVKFTASAVPDVSIHVVVQNPDTYHNYVDQTISLTSTPTPFVFNFTSDEDKATAKFIFQVGGSTAFVAHIDNVSVKGPKDLTPPPAPTVPSHIGELLANGTFGGGVSTPWWTNGVTTAVAQSRLEATITNGEANAWDAIVGQNTIPVFDTTGTTGFQYKFTVKAWASAPMSIRAQVQENGGAYTEYFGQTLALTTTPKTFTFTFDISADDPAAVVQFQMGGQGNNIVYFDNISLNGPEPVSHMQAGAPLIINGDFASGTNPWWADANATLATESGALKVGIISVGGGNTYDGLIGHNGIPLLKDGSYVIDFDAWASDAKTVIVKIQKDGGDYATYFQDTAALTTSSQHFHYTFTAGTTNPTAQFQFQLGANGLYTFYVDNVSVSGPKATPPTEFVPALHTNQTGYLPNAPKIATLTTDVTTPLAWTLYDSGHTPVSTGMTTVFGADAASGESVHHIDFSSVTANGTGYTLEAYGETSHPFDIGSNIYSQLKYDSLAYFYQTRAGIAITMPYAGRADLARPAGHIGVSPNQGDTSVTCFNQTDLNSVAHSGCSYTLDVSKGWYDAGDHGKYVVNGGIAAWTLLNEYERAKNLGGNLAAFADGEMNIPENANGVPDILDEARWEVEFLLSMQVPDGGMVDGVDRSGMVHHRIHDAAWTGLGLSPDQDPQVRYLFPPSTAATLNMAAVAAQCARIWASIDPTFSAKCLSAAQTAWGAAVANPAVYAANNFTGGGAYDDTDVTDEFYWAASELYITTGNQTYKDYITGSSYYLTIPSGPASGPVLTNSSMGWPKVQALGNISLAVVPSDLPSTDVQTIWENLVTVADGYLAAIPGQGYVLPYKPETSYQWGSNSDILNNMIILGLAYDRTEDPQYLAGITDGMDYILGRNPNDKSYVSGYGENPLTNPHHRFWVPELGAFPVAPAGVVSGGPNAGLQDPYIQTVFPSGCADQKCYVDKHDSYSSNEVAINWNAPLAWVSAFIDDVSNPVVSGTPTATATATATAGITATVTPTATLGVTSTVTPTRTTTAVITPTATYTITPTRTATPAAVTVTFSSVAPQDGQVLETSETSNVGGLTDNTGATFNLGDAADKKQYRGVLSFNTGTLPDNATITSVMLKVKQQSVVGGGNPVSMLMGFMMDIKKGVFSVSPSLQSADFQSAASHTYGPFVNSPVSGVYSFNLTAGKLDINKLNANSGLTQIRLRFKLDDNNNALANYLKLYSGNAGAAANRPQLVITYIIP